MIHIKKLSSIITLLCAVIVVNAQTISTTLITPSAPYCAGSNITVTFTADVGFNAGNQFNVELSDATGAFPGTVIGNLSSDAIVALNAVIPANTANGTAYRIRVTADNPSIPITLVNDNGADITINGLPAIAAGIYGNICVNGTPLVLAGTPLGGTFSGAGISGNNFDPAVAGAGEHAITYSFTDANTCTNTATTNITVNALPVVDAGTYGSLCIDATPIVLAGTPAGGSFSGDGVSGSSFDPIAAGAGTHAITYSFTDANTCTNTATTNITVNALPVVNAGTYGSLCIDAIPIVLAGTPAGGSFSGDGVSGNNFNPITAGAGTHAITYSFTDANTCTNTATTNIIVNLLPIVNAGSYSNVCIDGAAIALSGTPAGGTFSGTGVTGNNFDPAAAGAGTHIITYSFSDGNTCINSANTTITVNPLPIVNAGTSGDVCLNAANLALNGTPVGGSFSGAGVTANNFNPTIAGVGTHTITYSYTDGNGCFNSATTTIKVNPLPTANAGAAPAPQCFNVAGNNFILSGSSQNANPTVSWSVVNNPNALTVNISNGSTLNPAIQVSNGSGDVTLRLTVTSNQIPSCGIATSDVTINVIPIPTVNTISNSSICDSDPVNISFVSSQNSIPNPVSFAWTNTQPGIGLAANGINNTISFNATNNTNGPITGFIHVTPSLTINSVTCTGTPTAVTSITVKPTPKTDPIASQTFCNNSLITQINLNSQVLGTNLAWTRTGDNIGSASSGSGNIPQFTSNIGNSFTQKTANFTITPSIVGGCPGVASNFSITINPTPEVNAISDQAKCNNSPTDPVNFATSITGVPVTFDWNNNTPGIGLLTNGSGDISSFSTINNTNSPITATITVTPKIAGCPNGTDKTFTINIKPTPQVNAVISQDICDNSPTIPVNFSTTVVGTPVAFDWINTNSSIGLALNGTGNISSFITTNTSSSIITSNITVTPKIAGCADGASQNFSISVKPTPKVNQVTSQNICNNTPTQLINFGTVINPSSLVSFDWTNNNSTIGLASVGSGNILPFNATNNSSSIITSSVIVTPKLAGCPDGPSETFNISVKPTPRLTSPINRSVCSDGLFQYQATSTISNPVTTFSWERIANQNINNGFNRFFSGDTINEILSSNHLLNQQFVSYKTTLSSNSCASDTTITVAIRPVPQTPTFELPTGYCQNTSFLNVVANRDPFNNPLESFTWSADTIAGKTAQILQNGRHAIIKYAIGDNTIKLRSEIEGTGCPTPFTTRNIKTIELPNNDPRVIRRRNNLICLANNVSFYQWGRTDTLTLAEEKLNKENGQEYNIGAVADSNGFYYWVELKFSDEQCNRRAYYNEPAKKRQVITTDSENEFGIKAYPNPAQNNLNIALSGNLDGNYSLQLCDVTGKLIKNIDINTSKISIGIDFLQPGYYLLTCTKNGVKLATTRFIKN